MRMIADGFILNSASMGSPGMDEVRWVKPLRPGVNVRIRATVLEARASRSRPDTGFIKMTFEMIDDTDAAVTTMVSTLMMGRRQPGGAA
jgi:acyl dehydratase